jgi:effector-binding domain-containing protein
LLEGFKNGVKALGDYFEIIGSNARFGSLDFRNFIYSIAGKSSKVINIDKTNNDISIQRDLNFESFEDISDNSIHVEMLKQVFGSNIDAFNNLINDEYLRNQLLNVVKAHFDVVNDEKQNSPKQLIENGDEYGFAESYENFTTIINGLLSTTDKITADFVRDTYGIEDEEVVNAIASKVNEFKDRKNINKNTLGKLLQATIDAFDSNSLFPDNSSSKIIFDGINKEDVQKIRDIFKLVLKASPIKSEKNGNTYQWLAEDKAEKGSKKHLITLSDGKTTNVVSTKRLSSTGSKIQKIFNYIARSNKTINGKNFRKVNSKTKTTKTGYAVNSVNVFWENDERNNEAFAEELRNLHYDHTAEAYNEELAKEMIANSDFEGLKAMTESYTINESDLDVILSGAARRQITRDDI